MKKTVFAPIFCLLAVFYSLLPVSAHAQCSAENSAFKSGETLIYDLYFNWKFVWIPAGQATMATRQTIYEGEPAYRTRLITRTSETIDRIFVMRDTLTAVTGLDLTPRFYSKHAHEGNDYHTDDVRYTYSNGEVTAHMDRLNRRGVRRDTTYTSKYCIYDMVSMMLRARSFDATDYKVGHRLPFIMADGGRCEWKDIIYRGKEKIKMEKTGITYRCLVFSFVEKNREGEEEEIVRFFITDDKNHLPVRLDMYLNFGIAKAFLNMATNIRHPQTAIVKK